MRAGARNAHQQTTAHIAQQDGHERSHLDQAIATGQFTLAQMLRQVGVFDGAKQGRMQAHQEHTGQEQRHPLKPKAHASQSHHHQLQHLHAAHDHGLVILVSPLPCRGRQQHKGQDEQGPNHQTGHLGLQPADLQVIRHQNRERKLEQVVIGRPQKLGHEKRRKAALRQQGKLTDGGLTHWCILFRKCLKTVAGSFKLLEPRWER